MAVAIIAVWFYNFFTNKVDDLTLDIDETASELVDSIIRETDGVPEAAAGCDRPQRGASGRNFVSGLRPLRRRSPLMRPLSR